ncbi:MAG: hypothetical protein JJU27_14260 [Gammaproteobacteria bacterium]|nr:hypothetical protein [Gammaproteobacteria bacterium]
MKPSRAGALAGWSLLLLVPSLLLAVAFSQSYRHAVPEEALHVVRAHWHPPAAQPPDVTGTEPEVALPHDWARLPPHEDSAWYSAFVDLNVPTNRLWGVYLPSVSMNVQVYLNGELLGQGGRLESPVARLWGRPLYFTIPNGVLHPGRNLLQLRLLADPAATGLLGELYLGPHELLLPVFEQRHFVRHSLVWLIAVSLLFTGVGMGLIWVLRPTETMYGWLAATVLIWGVHTLNLLVVEIPVPSRLWDWLINYASLGWFTAALVVFIHRFLGLRRPRIERAYWLWCAGGSLLLGLVPSPSFYWVAMHIWNGSLLALGIYPSVLLLQSWWQRYEFRILLMALCGAGIMVFALHDWLGMIGLSGRRHEGLLIQYAAPFPLILFGLILLRDFVAARTEAEVLNRDLEQRVAQKSAELEMRYGELRAMERERVVADERERIMRDMHDGLGGHLVSSIALVENGGPSADELAQTLRAALDDLRLMIDSLDPMEGDLVMLLGAFRERIEPQLNAAGVTLEWSVTDVPRLSDLGPTRALQVLRILQEAVTNVIRHAAASHLRVLTGVATQQVFIEIADDGVGISDANPRGRGLANMQRRATDLGGVLQIEEADPGTRLRLVLPILA